MANLEIEQRSDGSLLLTDRGGARWGVAVSGLAAGAVMLTTVAASEVTVLGSVVVVPLGLIVLLAGCAALRHRDWILFDRQARQIASRRGLASLFRSVSALAFDDVEAIVLDSAGTDGDVAIRLRFAGDSLWPVDRSADAAYITRLVAVIQEAGGWPVLRDGVPERRRDRVRPVGPRQ